MINFAIKLIATVAVTAVQMGLQASRRTFGPRLDELTITVADYGTPLPRFLGARRFACSVFHAEDLKEVENNTKVKGAGKQTTYSYLATFACAISDNPIDKVLKIWFDDKLVYDATRSGPMSLLAAFVATFGGGDTSLDIKKYMRIYKGGEDQLPDPRYVTFCEDKFGADSAPAYRGVSYLFFEELPVDNFGNRIPQIAVLASSEAVPARPYQQVDEANVGTTGHYAAGGGWIAHYGNGDGDPIDWFDAPSRKLLGASSGSGVASGTVVNVDLAADGTAYMFGQYISFPSAFSALYVCPPMGSFSRIDSTGPWFSGPTRVFDLAAGARSVLTAVPGGNTGYLVLGAPVANALTSRDFALHGDGRTWGLFEPDSSSASITLERLVDGYTLTFTGLVTRSSPDDATFCHVAKSAHFFVIADGKWYTINDDTTGTPGTIKASGAWSGSTLNLPRKSPQSTSFWSNYNEISLADASTIRTENPSLWVAENTNGENFYDAVGTAMWVYPQFATHQTIRDLDRVSNAGVTLAAIVNAMCDAAALTDRDASALTQLVQGYSWTRGDVKSQMEPILDIHDVDGRPHDFSIQFLPRGGAAAGTLLTQDFAKSGEDSPRYKVTIAEDTDLPKILRVNFADVDFEQQTNNVLSPLTVDSVDTQRDVSIDLTTYAASKDEAQQLSDRYLRRQWNSRQRIEVALTSQSLGLEPGDVTTLDFDGIQQKGRLEKQTIVGSRIDCTFVRDEQFLTTLNSATGPTMDGRDEPVITIPAPVRGFVIDAPLMDDADADVRPLLYAGAGVYAGLSFPGAVIYEATGAGAGRAYDTLFDTASSGATWGLCESTLADVPSPWLWDRGNTLTVSLQRGSLTSVAEADIDANPSLNLILVGRQGAWEYVNFTTATLNGDGTYTLSGFKRGRRGTEWACAGHAAGEAWVLPSSLKADEMGLDDVGAALSFKAQSIGRSLEAALPIDVNPYSGATLKPYAPARVEWSTDGTDMFGAIVRRTRVGGAWVGGSTIPLSESSEAYEVDVYNGSTFKRTISVSGTNLFTYAGAEITADGNTVGTPPPVNAYQMSDAVGRGFALAA